MSRYRYQTTNPRARCNPLRSVPFIRHKSTVLGWSVAEKVTFEIARDRNDLACAEKGYAAACTALGRANGLRKPMRKIWVAEAFRRINAARRALRLARGALATSLARWPDVELCASVP